MAKKGLPITEAELEQIQRLITLLGHSITLRYHAKGSLGNRSRTWELQGWLPDGNTCVEGQGSTLKKALLSYQANYKLEVVHYANRAKEYAKQMQELQRKYAKEKKEIESWADKIELGELPEMEEIPGHGSLRPDRTLKRKLKVKGDHR